MHIKQHVKSVVIFVNLSIIFLLFAVLIFACFVSIVDITCMLS